MRPTTKQVRREVRDHLAGLAEERGLSVGQLVDAFTAKQPSAAQRAERLAADREVVRRVIGLGISDAEFDEAPDILGNIYKIAADRIRVAEGTAPAGVAGGARRGGARPVVGPQGPGA